MNRRYKNPLYTSHFVQREGDMLIAPKQKGFNQIKGSRCSGQENAYPIHLYNYQKQEPLIYQKLLYLWKVHHIGTQDTMTSFLQYILAHDIINSFSIIFQLNFLAGKTIKGSWEYRELRKTRRNF